MEIKDDIHKGYEKNVDEIKNIINSSKIILEEKSYINSLINNETLRLTLKLMGNDNYNIEESDIDLLPLIFKLLFLPINKVKFNNEEDIIGNLLYIEKIINWMMMNFEDNDFISLSNYNPSLTAIVNKYTELIGKYEESDIVSHLYNSIIDIQIISTTLSHVASLLYFYQKDYDNDYQLLEKLFIKILENYDTFLYNCYSNNMFFSNIGELFSLDSVKKEFIICKKIMDKEYCPPIKLVK